MSQKQMPGQYKPQNLQELNKKEMPLNSYIGRIQNSLQFSNNQKREGKKDQHGMEENEQSNQLGQNIRVISSNSGSSINSPRQMSFVKSQPKVQIEDQKQKQIKQQSPKRKGPRAITFILLHPNAQLYWKIVTGIFFDNDESYIEEILEIILEHNNSQFQSQQQDELQQNQ